VQLYFSLFTKFFLEIKVAVVNPVAVNIVGGSYSLLASQVIHLNANRVALNFHKVSPKNSTVKTPTHYSHSDMLQLKYLGMAVRFFLVAQQ
jgi:hypothetical protein